jgi:hypothetical protein
MLLFRSFSGFRIVDKNKEREAEADRIRRQKDKKVSKDTGEFVEYEDVD